MKPRLILFESIAFLFLLIVPAHAQNRLEVTPFVGYETSASYPVNNSSATLPLDRLRVNDSLAFGTFLDFSLNRHLQVEFMWNRNNTSYSARDIFSQTYTSAYHSNIDQYQFGFLRMFRSSETRLRPYVAASLGFTHSFNNNGNPDDTKFSFSVGGGTKYYVTSHLGLRADLRYLPTYGSSSTETICDPFFGFCQNGNVSHYLNRASFTGGIIFKF